MNEHELKSQLTQYITLFEQLHVGNLDRFNTIFSTNARFKDPFNDVTGVAPIRNIFKHMFDTVKSPKFDVHHHAINGRIAYLHWSFSCTTSNHIEFNIVGLSQVTFDHQGKVSEHIDYWDASEQFLSKLPILGRIIKSINRKMQA